MAKKESTKAAQDNKAEKAKKRRPIGIYLRVATRAEVEKISHDENLPIHAILAYAVAYFVRQYRAGKVKIETTQKTTLNLDL